MTTGDLIAAAPNMLRDAATIIGKVVADNLMPGIAKPGFPAAVLARIEALLAANVLPLVQAAPEMAALLREEYDDTTESTGRADRERRARALLARIDGET